jgi:hypothetical protein
VELRRKLLVFPVRKLLLRNTVDFGHEIPPPALQWRGNGSLVQRSLRDVPLRQMGERWLARWLHLTWLPRAAILISIGTACDAKAFAEGDARIKFDPYKAGPVADSVVFPSFGCVGSVAKVGTLREAKALMAEGDREKPQPQDKGWSPEFLTGLAVWGASYAVTDRQGARVTVMDSTFLNRREWGTKGSGPGELQSPVAVAFDQRGDTIWVLDDRRKAIIGFDLSGRFVREFAVPATAVDFAVQPDGTFYVAHQFMIAGAHGPVTIVSRVGSGREPSPVLSVDASELSPPRFVLPGFMAPRVRALGHFIAVIYSAAGVVDVFDAGKGQFTRVSTIRTCISKELVAAYAKQRGDSKHVQSWVSLVADVRLEGDTIVTISARADLEKRYAIQRFNLNTGQDLGAVALPAGRLRLPEELRFGARGSELVAINAARGIVVRLDVRKKDMP